MIGFGNRASFVGCSVYSPHVSVSPEFVLISRYGRDFFFCDTWFDSGDPEWGTQNKKKKKIYVTILPRTYNISGGGGPAFSDSRTPE